MEAGIFKAKPGLRGGYGHVKCPNPGCEHILFEASKRFWHTNRIERTLCPVCSRSVALIACIQAENDAGELIVRYWCRHCQKGFEKIMIGVRKYCAGCQTYQNIYFTLSLAFSNETAGSPEVKEQVLPARKTE